jgi:hypothetical protein
VGAFNAPIGHCQCCDSDFPYIDMGGWSDSGLVRTVINNKHLCRQCGGTPIVHEVHG